MYATRAPAVVAIANSASPVRVCCLKVHHTILSRSACVFIEQEIDDLLMMGNDTRIFHTSALEPSELDAYCTDQSPALEVSGNTTHRLPIRAQNVDCQKHVTVGLASSQMLIRAGSALINRTVIQSPLVAVAGVTHNVRPPARGRAAFPNPLVACVSHLFFERFPPFRWPTHANLPDPGRPS